MRVASLGPFARRFLDQHAIARVSAAFARSFHLEAGRDALCIVDTSLGDGALNAVLAEPFASLSIIPVGAGVRIANGVVAIAGGVSLDARAASDWRPPVVAIAENANAALAALKRAALARAPTDGVFRAAFDDASDASLLVQRALRDRARLFMQWLVAPEEGPPPVAGLIGLGSGLTPAGDDFLGGAMIAARLAGCADRARAIAAAIEAQGGEATTILSGAMLRAAAEGVGGAALHALLSALGRGDADAAMRLLDAIDRIGHTSGWDALAGALAMLDSCVGERRSG